MEDPHSATLIMLSGGPRSAYLLWELLQNSNQQIYVHHVRLMADDCAADTAAQSCQQIVDYCSIEHRAIQLSQSLLDYQTLTVNPVALSCIAYEAGLAVQSIALENPYLQRCIIAESKLQSGDTTWTRHLHNCYQAAAFPGEPPGLSLMAIDHDSAVKSLPQAISQLVI